MVIAHVSKSLKVAEGNYFRSEKEILAIVYFISKFRYYLVGQHFVISSDNQPLSSMLKCKLANARISRWIMAIQEYDFSIKYCKASENKIADTLSRYPPIIEEQYSSTRNEVQILTIKYALPDELKNRLKCINVEQQRDAKLKIQ